MSSLAIDAMTEATAEYRTTSPVVEEARAPRGWWRRNLWGLLALLPILAATGWLHYDSVKERYWEGQPRIPVSAGADGWAPLASARVRLVTLEPADDLKTYAGKPFTPPSGVAVWRAVLAFEAPDQEAIGGCKLLLEDTTGKTYGAGPRELDGARLPFATSCLAEDQPAPPSYEVTAYFTTPSAAQAAAVRIEVTRDLPRYARLTTTG